MDDETKDFIIIIESSRYQIIWFHNSLNVIYISTTERLIKLIKYWGHLILYKSRLKTFTDQLDPNVFQTGFLFRTDCFSSEHKSEDQGHSLQNGESKMKSMKAL